MRNVAEELGKPLRRYAEGSPIPRALSGPDEEAAERRADEKGKDSATKQNYRSVLKQGGPGNFPGLLFFGVRAHLTRVTRKVSADSGLLKIPENLIKPLPPYYAKITDSPISGEWVVEVDWVKHEYRQ